jgi:carboxypeptidase Taq
MQLGRSEAFLKRLLPAVRQLWRQPRFKKELFAWNQRVKPGFIRVDADEVSYPAHVILRYEIERALINGEIEVDDIPALWDEKCRPGWACPPRQLPQRLYAGYPLDRRRVWLLPVVYAWRDVRRSAFPGRAKRAARAERAIAQGDFSALFDWLRQNIWQHGSRFSTSQLINRLPARI